jgi:1,4-alpha-glucan branching enzyme
LWAIVPHAAPQLRDAGAVMAQTLFCHSNDRNYLMTSIRDDGQVEFRFFRRNVDRVCLVGDFNGSNNQPMAMDSSGDGWWTALMRFDAGEYRFRYLADGQWFNDYAAYGLEVTSAGLHSIVRIPPFISEQQINPAKKVA